MPYFSEVFGNAASKDHIYGLEAKRAVDKAREQIAKAINARPDEIIFTSGATESNNLAIFGVAEKLADKGNHIVTCVTEHKAVLDCCKELERRGKRVTYLPVDRYGLVDPDEVRKAITSSTILVTIMVANNEIGTIAPIKEIGDISSVRNVLFHTDATQAIGRVLLDVQSQNVHLLSLSGHKIYGPKGIGVLYRRRSNPRAMLYPQLFGGGHEKGLRSGTLNVPAIVGLGKAAEIICDERDERNERYSVWTSRMIMNLKEALGNIQLNGHPTGRLSNNLNVSIPGIDSRALLIKLKDVSVSTGSACTSSAVEPSHVLRAIGVDEERIHSSIRISVGATNDSAQIDEACNRIVKATSELRGASDTDD